ncbi:acyl carrier protein [Patescibacteria group bacterium]
MDKTNKIKEKIKKDLAEFLGVDTDDIDSQDNIMQDLHMSPSDATDFLSVMEEKGYDITGLDLTEIETFDELADFLITHTE